MNSEASAVVIDLANQFTELIQSIDSGWTKGYYRFRAESVRYGSSASYDGASGVTLIGAVKHSLFYDSMNEKGANLLRFLGKEEGGFLLSVDDKFDYDIKFEWIDLKRWEISKMDGRSGIPEDA